MLMIDTPLSPGAPPAATMVGSAPSACAVDISPTSDSTTGAKQEPLRSPLQPASARRSIRRRYRGHERNHQELDNELIVGVASPRGVGTVRRVQRLGGL